MINDTDNVSWQGLTLTSYVAQSVGEPYDFIALTALFAKIGKLGEDWNFARQPHADTFTTETNEAAQKALVGTDKRGNLLIPTGVPLSRLRLEVERHYIFADYVRHLKAQRIRSRIEYEDTMIIIGSRTSDWQLTIHDVTSSEDNIPRIQEVLVVRSGIADKMRSLLLTGQWDIADMVDCIRYEYLFFPPKRELPELNVKVARVATAKEPAHKIAANAARSLWNIYRDTDVNHLDRVLELIPTLLDQMLNPPVQTELFFSSEVNPFDQSDKLLHTAQSEYQPFEVSVGSNVDEVDF